MENKQKQYNLDSVFTYNKLAEALNAVGYKEVGEYVASVDGWTYFSCVWQDEYIRVKFLINKFDKVIISVAADLSAYVLAAVESELKEVIEGTILTLPEVIKVVKVVPNKSPEIVEVEKDLSSIYKTVEGVLDAALLPQNIALWFNGNYEEEEELEENFSIISCDKYGENMKLEDVIEGPVMFTGVENKIITSLTESQIETIKKAFSVDRRGYCFVEEN